MSVTHRALDRLQRLVARSAIATRIAILLRNQCRCVIKYRLAESPNVEGTGERLLLRAVGRRIRFAIDVGANRGDWLRTALEETGDGAQFLAFEPSRSAFVLLEALRSPNVEIAPLAIGDVEGELDFSEEPDGGGGSSFVPEFLRTVTVKRRMPVSTIAVEAGKRFRDRIDFLKIDAEGYDFRVLLGCGSLLDASRIGVVQFEYNRSWQLAGNTLGGAIRYLENLQFSVFVLKRDGLYRFPYYTYEDYFEYTNFAAISNDFMSSVRDIVRGDI